MSTLLSSLRTFLMVMVSLIGVSYASAQVDEWAGPQAPFPTQNIAAPVNTSSEEQTKEGLLTLGGLISTSDTTLLTTLRVATTTDPLTKSLKALFAGNIGAKEYCDEKGENCVASASLGRSNTVYLDPLEPAYTLHETVNWAPAAYSHGAGKNTLVSLTSIKAATPQMQEETRLIKGIIVDAKAYIRSTSCSADAKWYYVGLSIGSVDPNVGYTYSYDPDLTSYPVNEFVYTMNDPDQACSGAANRTIGNVNQNNIALVYSLPIQNVGPLWSFTSTISLFNLPANTPVPVSLDVYYTVVGYITE